MGLDVAGHVTREGARRKEQDDDRLISFHYLMKPGLDIIIASYGGRGCHTVIGLLDDTIRLVC